MKNKLISQQTFFKNISTMILATVVMLILVSVYDKNVQCKVVRDTKSDDGPIVETSIGIIKGIRATDGDYNMFMGIPYATVNESNIFGAAIPRPPFIEVFEAYDDSAICPQQEEFNFTITGTLDCLHLNVYVPNTSVTNLPVMAYIFGGNFELGFPGRFLLGPKYLVRHDVILVTINYRLGPYGFMCLDTPEIPGNAGLKDQMLALRWIQDHIQSFGGDPNQVTLFGNSAGASSVGIHIMSDYEKNFNNIILQSGTAFFPGIGMPPDNTAPLKLAESLGLITDDVNGALSFLSENDVHAVIEASLSMVFAPCLEKEVPGVKRFLPTTAINSNHYKVDGVAALIGFTSEEMLILFPEEADSQYWPIWESLFESTLINAFNFDDIMLKEAAQTVRLFYVGDEDINNNVRDQMLNFSSDNIFVHCVIRTLAPYFEAGAEKIYQYVFSYDGNRNFVKYRDNLTQSGVAHADELGYLFDMGLIQEEPTLEDQLIIDRMTLMWTNFAKYRDPTPETNALLPVKWNPITNGSPYHYLNIDTEMSTGQRYAHDRMTFWDLFYKTYAKYEKGYIDQNLEEEEPTDSSPGSSTIISLRTFLLTFVIFITFSCS